MTKGTSEGHTAAIRVLLEKIENSQDVLIYRKFLDSLANAGKYAKMFPFNYMLQYQDSFLTCEKTSRLHAV